jgi:hypothetical protein
MKDAISPYIDKVRRICTADADIRSGEEVYMVSGTKGSGSGTIRSTNADAIFKYVANLDDEDLGYSDINIILTSLSGGSGSVIAPALIKRIHRRSGGSAQFIFIGVGHTSSETFTNNTLNSLKSMVNITTTDKIYLPSLIFDNSSVGEDIVNATMKYRLTQLVYLFALPTYNLDPSDRKNFLNGIRTMNAAPGMRLLRLHSVDEEDTHVNTGEVYHHEEGEIFDALLSIGHETEDGGRNYINWSSTVRHVRQGIFKSQRITALAASISSSDAGIASLMKEIDNQATRFQSQSKHVTSIIRVDPSDTNEHGMVL